MKPFFCDNENVPHHVSWVYGCCCSTQQDAGSYTQIYAPYIHLECLLTVLKLSGAAEGTPEVNPPEWIHSGRSWRRRWSSRSSAFSEQSCWKLLHQQEWWKLTGETGEDCELISMNERWMVATIPGSVIISSICKSISLSIYPLSLCEISREHTSTRIDLQGPNSSYKYNIFASQQVDQSASPSWCAALTSLSEA